MTTKTRQAAAYFDAADERAIAPMDALLEAWAGPLPHEDAGWDLRRRLQAVAQAQRDHMEGAK